jgi:hypothetical protein
MDINKAMVEYGYAWNCSTEPGYAEASERAKKSRKGLWASFSQMPPWDYRDAIEKRKKQYRKAVQSNSKKKSEKKTITLNKSTLTSHTLSNSVKSQFNSSESKNQKIVSQLANHPVGETSEEIEQDDDRTEAYQMIFKSK